MKHFAGPAFMRLWARIISLLLGFGVYAQDIAVGTWRTHFSYQNARTLVATEDKVFCAVENGLFSYDTDDQSVRKLSKLDGLSGAGISAMDYNSEDRVLIIGYSSGLIDLIYEDEIVSIRDVANSNLEGDKNINDLSMGNNQAFLGTDLGVIVIDLSNGQISENYVQIGSGGNEVSVEEVHLIENSLFIRTNEGIQSGSLNQNLLDFNNWTMYPGTGSFREMNLIGDDLYALADESLFQFSNGNWEDTNVDLPSGADKIFEVNDQLFTFSAGDILRLNESDFELVVETQAPQVNDIASLQNQLYIADGMVGLINENGENLSPSGPLSDTYSRIKVLRNEVYGFHAPSVFFYNGTQKIDSYSFFSAGSWSFQGIDGFDNISDVAIFNGARFFSSIGDGLYLEESDEILEDIPQSNSALDTMITSLDSRDRLWVAGAGDQPIHYLDDEGDWLSYGSSTVLNTVFTGLDISENGISWALSQDGELTVIDADEDQIDILSRSDGVPSFTTDFDISIEDNAWLATSRGPAFFPSASFVFFESNAIQPTFENRILFEDQEINSVMTDGGNRVWFGTNRGLWIFDENTSEQVAIFDELNSPLPSNIILDLAYNGSSGEVFVLTDKGMVSYRSASSNGSRVHRNVSVFPNPVRPNYVGQVGITGLARNTSLKITDVNGNLVKELDANGSSASWDLLDQNGGGVVTGIYLFFSSTSEGEETYVGKVAVIR